MFMTQNHTEELLGTPFSQEQFWSRVELAKDERWYYVSTSYYRVGGNGRRNYLLTEVADLVALIEETGEFFWIERVMVVTPPKMNGTGCWKMYRLKELVAAADSTDLTSVDYIYRLEDDLYFATRDISEVNSLRWRQILYSEAQHAHPDDGDK